MENLLTDYLDRNYRRGKGGEIAAALFYFDSLWNLKEGGKIITTQIKNKNIALL